MLRVICLISLICASTFILQKNGFCETPSAFQREIKEIREANQDLQAQLNEQRKLIEQLQKTKDEEEIRRITEDLLDEREEEKKLATLFSDGGLENMIFHGYVDLEWKSEAFDRAQGGQRGHHFFDNHHFNLWFGYRITDNLIAKSEIEIEHAGEAFGLEFATLEWKPFASDLLELVMGMMLVPLGVENPVHASVRNKLISRPLPSISIIPGTYSDIGIEARGWFPSFSDAKIRYHFYLVNGLGDEDGDQIYEQNALKRGRDNNGNKAVGTQIAVFPFPDLELGGSGYFGKWDDRDRNKTVIWVSHFIYQREPVEVRAEYVKQEIKAALGEGHGDAILEGFYMQGTFSFSGPGGALFNRLELVTRYDWVANPDGVQGLKQGEIPGGKSTQRLAVGFILRPMGQLQFKVEYLYRDNKAERDDQGLALQVVANW